MNNSIGRILDGISAILREDVIPRIEDPYARGQAVGVIDLLNNLRPRIDWAQAPLQAQVQGLHEAVRAAERTLRGASETPPLDPVGEIPAAGPTTAELVELRTKIEDHVATLFRWLDERREASEPARTAEEVLRRAVHDDLEREMKLVSKPLFAEIAAGAKGAEKS